jgi:hypothetical protein
MKRNPEKQYGDNRQMEIWPEGFSNEGHVYAALGVEPTSLAFEEQTCVTTNRVSLSGSLITTLRPTEW